MSHGYRSAVLQRKQPQAAPRTVVTGAGRSQAPYTVSITGGENGGAADLGGAAADVATGRILTAAVLPDPTPTVPQLQWTIAPPGQPPTAVSGETGATYTPRTGTDGLENFSLIRAVATIDGVAYTSAARRFVETVPRFDSTFYTFDSSLTTFDAANS